MSLINEALERARQEAVRRQAADRGVPPPPLPRSSYGDRVWWKVAVGLMAAALVVSLVALSVVLWGGRDGRETAAIAESATEPPGEGLLPPAGEVSRSPTSEAPIRVTDVAAPENTRGAEPVASEPPAEPPPASSSPPAVAPPVTSRATPRDAPPAPTSTVAPSRREPERLPRPAPAPDEPWETVRMAEPPDSVAGEPAPTPVYLQRFELADGGEIQLEGIAWSATGPFTLLNGKVVGVGEIVQGYKVVAISPEEVELEGIDGAIILRLK